MNKVLPRRTLRRHRVASGTGQHSMRINDPFRSCFVWQSGNASHVEIVGYHR